MRLLILSLMINLFVIPLYYYLLVMVYSPQIEAFKAVIYTMMHIRVKFG